MDIKVTEIQKIKLSPDEVLVVKMNRGGLPESAWQQRAIEIRDMLRTYFLSNKIIVVSETAEFSVIKEENVESDYCSTK